MRDADITPDPGAGRVLIEGYGPGGFQIAGTRHSGSIQVSAGAVAPWTVADVSEITPESLAFVLDAEPGYEVLLIGTGAKMQFLSPALRQAIRARGPVPEFMDTGAAARTFNLLQTESRRVAAALIAV
jgi:uncharacterized protein